MTQEIIYTSAPSGLRPGSRGFCTVAATRGIAKPLVDQLEDLSGYRHIFLSNDAQSALNPIVYSNLKLSVAGRSYHVVSRICDAGLDYTQRTNKLAHHVALEPKELTPAGPAALLEAPGFMTTSWSGEPTMRDAGPLPPHGNIAAGVCHEWGRLTGDAGWAGYIAEALVSETRKQIVLVYRPGTNVIALVGETLALLPNNKRWDATFCTYFTKLPPTVDCRWRCVVDGTPEAEALSRSSTAIIVDLRKPMPRAADSLYVSAARTGIAVASVGPTAQGLRSPSATGADPDDALLAALENNDSRRGAQPAANRQRRPTASGAAAHQPPPISGGPFDYADASAPMAVKPALRKPAHPAVYMAIGSIGTLILGGIALLGYSFLTQEKRNEFEIAAITPEPATVDPSGPPVDVTPAPELATTAEPIPPIASVPPVSVTPEAAPLATAATPDSTATSTPVPKPTAAPAESPASIPNAIPAVASFAGPKPTPPSATPVPAVGSGTDSQAEGKIAYFKPTSIASGPPSSLGALGVGTNYQINVILNDSNKDSLTVNPMDGKAIILKRGNKGAQLNFQDVGSFYVRTIEGATPQLIFEGNAFLKTLDHASFTLQTSLIAVSFSDEAGTTMTTTFAPFPGKWNASTPQALLAGGKSLGTFVGVKEPTFRFRTQFEVEGQRQDYADAYGANGGPCVSDLAIDASMTLRILTKFVVPAGGKVEVGQEIDVGDFKERYPKLGEALFQKPDIRFNDKAINDAETFLRKQSDKNLQAIQDHEKSLANLRKNNQSQREINAEEAKLSASRGEEEAIAKASSELKILRTFNNDLKAFKKYKVHFEVSSKAGDDYVVLLSTDEIKQK
jgi:hypothetical protein